MAFDHQIFVSKWLLFIVIILVADSNRVESSPTPPINTTLLPSTGDGGLNNSATSMSLDIKNSTTGHVQIGSSTEAPSLYWSHVLLYGILALIVVVVLIPCVLTLAGCCPNADTVAIRGAAGKADGHRQKSPDIGGKSGISGGKVIKSTFTSLAKVSSGIKRGNLKLDSVRRGPLIHASELAVAEKRTASKIEGPTGLPAVEQVFSPIMVATKVSKSDQSAGGGECSPMFATPATAKSMLSGKGALTKSSNSKGQPGKIAARSQALQKYLSRDFKHAKEQSAAVDGSKSSVGLRASSQNLNSSSSKICALAQNGKQAVGSKAKAGAASPSPANADRSISTMSNAFGSKSRGGSGSRTNSN